MTIAEFFGSALLAFGAPLVLFVLTIANDPIRVIIMILAAFCWLLSFLLSSILWFSVVPLREYLAFGLFFAVLFQELSRFGVYCLLRKMESLLTMINDVDRDFMEHKSTTAYVSGFAYGIMSGSFALMNVLADSAGPGTLGLKSGSEYFFTTSAAITLCMVLLNTFWSVIFFNGCDERNALKIIWVVGSHYLVSGLTLLNSQELYAATILPAYTVLIVTIVMAFKCAGGSKTSLVQSFKRVET